MTRVSSDERPAFFKQHFGVTGDQVLTERKHAPFLQIGTAEYRAAHLALPPAKRHMSPADWQRRLDKLEAQIAESERKWAEFGL